MILLWLGIGESRADEHSYGLSSCSFCGGGGSAFLRFYLDQVMAFCYVTLSVTVLGSFLMGLAFAYFAGRLIESVPLFLAAVIFGGFTTFSQDLLKLLDIRVRLGFAVACISHSFLCALATVLVGCLAMRAESA